MSDLVNLRSNVFYRKIEGDYEKFFELVFIVQRPEYELSTDHEVVRNRGLQSRRVIVKEDEIDNVIDALESLKNMEQEDLD